MEEWGPEPGRIQVDINSIYVLWCTIKNYNVPRFFILGIQLEISKFKKQPERQMVKFYITLSSQANENYL